jgi:hypothetical protein
MTTAQENIETAERLLNSVSRNQDLGRMEGMAERIQLANAFAGLAGIKSTITALEVQQEALQHTQDGW